MASGTTSRISPCSWTTLRVISVQGDISNWTVVGPADTPYHFQSQITQDIPNELIAWETLPDSEAHSAGFVRFDENRDGSTRVTVQMSYVPPVGVLGHAVAQLMGLYRVSGDARRFDETSNPFWKKVEHPRKAGRWTTLRL